MQLTTLPETTEAGGRRALLAGSTYHALAFAYHISSTQPIETPVPANFSCSRNKGQLAPGGSKSFLLFLLAGCESLLVRWAQRLIWCLAVSKQLLTNQAAGSYSQSAVAPQSRVGPRPRERERERALATAGYARRVPVPTRATTVSMLVSSIYSLCCGFASTVRALISQVQYLQHVSLRASIALRKVHFSQSVKHATVKVFYLGLSACRALALLGSM